MTPMVSIRSIGLCRLCLTVGLIALAAVSAPKVSQAQESLRIAAIVNDDVISGYDLFVRMRLVMALSRIPDNAETRQRLAPQVLRRLIDERLQSQDLKKFGIEVTPSETERTLRSLERANNIPAGQVNGFLARAGVPGSAINAEIETRLGWEKLIGQMFGPRIAIGDEEVEDVYQDLKANTGKPEYLLSEIYLPVDSPSQKAEVRNLAQRIIQQLRSGSNFSSLATSFSQSPSAATGGDLGWMLPNQIAPDLAMAVQALTPPNISEPIETLSGYYIIGMRDKRISRGPVNPNAKVNIQQLFFPIDPEWDQATVRQQIAAAESFRARSTSCQAMEGMSRATGSQASGNMGDVALSGVAPAIRQALAGLPDGMASEIVRMPQGLSILMICSRSEDDDGEAVRNQIRQRLFAERVTNAGRRHLRELRRNAFIDIRL